MTAAAGPWSWSAPLHRSRCGASHQRRGVPCQDASLCADLRSADGLPVGLMAVADGHGGSRYWLSNVGSRLACELVIAMAAEDLAKRRLSSNSADKLEAVRAWLADDLAARLVSAWNEAIKADWQERELPEAHQHEAFASQTYGSTLALVVLTPHWWGHTGLGDWDLVLLSDHQPDRILSQEAEQGTPGEATESLCLPRASRCFAARTAVYPLSGGPQRACGLVLSTDGIRKSCATDADHLALCRYLLEQAQPRMANGAGPTERLDASLDRVSREGSGDDVSVALACFGTLQPVAVEAPEVPALPPLPDLEASPSSSSSTSSPATSRQRRTATQPPQPLRPALIGGVILMMIAAGGVAVCIGLGLLPPWRRSPQTSQPPAAQSLPLSKEQRQGVEQEISRLCSGPDAISAILKTRNKQFTQLRSNPEELGLVLLRKDWLGAVIGLSDPGESGLGNLKICQELAAALQQHWSTTLTPRARTEASNDGLRTGQRHPSSPGATGPNDGSTGRSTTR